MQAEAQRFSRLDLGSNTMQALIVNDKPAVAIEDGALQIDPEYATQLTYSVAENVIYVLGTITVNSVDIDIKPERIFIAAVGAIANQDLNRLTITVDDDARVHIEAE